MTARIRPDLDAIPGYVPGRSFPGAAKLASNETTHGPLPSVRSAVADAAAGVNRYPDNQSTQLTESIAEFLSVAPDHVAVGCGSVALCQELVQITCGDGDEVVFAWRSFEAYPIVTRVAGATPVAVPLTAAFEHDLDAMLAAITDRTRLVFVCTPNNPTGTVVSTDAMTTFLDAVPPHVLVVLDEAYYEYSGGALDGVALSASYPNLFVLRTFSKAYGLAGLRLGYGVGDPAIVTALKKVHVPFSVSAVAQAAGLASLAASGELLARTDAVIAERTRVGNALRAAGYRVPESAANFVWLPLGSQSGAFAAASADAGAVVRAYGDDGVRVTIGDPHENDTFATFAVGASGDYTAC